MAVPLVALAAGGWSLFSRTPSGAEPFALAGGQAEMGMPPAGSAKSATVRPEPPRRGAHPSRVGGRPSPQPSESTRRQAEAPSAAPLISPPEVPTVVVPRIRPPEVVVPLPELLPKTTQSLGRITGQAAEQATGLVSEVGPALQPAELNWSAVARCASSNDPKAVSPDGYGLYRFTLEDWRSVGGTGLPSEATPQEQTKRAQLLYARADGRWRELWPQCGSLLFQR